MIRIEWNVTRSYLGNYAIIRFWIYDKDKRLYRWKQLVVKSIHKLRDPKRLFLRHPEHPSWNPRLSYTKDYKEFEVTRAELEKGFPRIDL